MIEKVFILTIRFAGYVVVSQMIEVLKFNHHITKTADNIILYIQYNSGIISIKRLFICF